ncbi:MAG: hypothetical protein M1826_007305 [Phylliscum demangeonii]|nr:MAG: hypothetical protein M1826_007305 [Phylliscum demangeonii]
MADEERSVEEDDRLRSFLPTSFGKQPKAVNLAARLNQSKRAVAAPAPPDPPAVDHPEAGREESRDEDGHDSDDDDDDDADNDDDEDEFPTSHEIVLQTHEKAVTSVSLDASGSRLVTGSSDCTIKLHDFASMTPTTLRAFKSVDPSAGKSSASSETHPVHQALFNPLAAGLLLVVSATRQAKILDRDGAPVAEFVKGDMYLRDMHQTKGHVSEITAGAWHPTERQLCVTAGTDSTLRVWDINRPRAQKEVIVHKSRVLGAGGRTRMTAVAWASAAQASGAAGHVLLGAALDGSLAVWSGNGPFHRPAAEVRQAHARETWTSGVDISPDGRLAVTRGGDDTVKTWDLRKFTTPLATLAHPSTSSQHPTSSIRFGGPAGGGSYILTGSGTGHLHILNAATLAAEHTAAITPGSAVISALWHPTLNQLATGSANGQTHILYHPTRSSPRGAAQVMARAPKRRHIDDDPRRTTDVSQLGLSGDAIISPHAVLGRGRGRGGAGGAGAGAGAGRGAAYAPVKPAATPFAKSQPDERHIRDHIPLSSMRDEDPREALLKYAQLAREEPIFTKAWQVTQPTTVYAEVSDEEAGEGGKGVEEKEEEEDDDDDGGGGGVERKRVKR